MTALTQSIVCGCSQAHSIRNWDWHDDNSFTLRIDKDDNFDIRGTLISSIRNCELDLFDQLIDDGRLIKVSDRLGQTPLHWATYVGSIEQLQSEQLCPGFGFRQSVPGKMRASYFHKSNVKSIKSP